MSAWIVVSALAVLAVVCFSVHRSIKGKLFYVVAATLVGAVSIVGCYIAVYSPLRHLRQAQPFRVTLAPGENAFAVDLVKGTYVLKIGEDLPPGGTPVTPFALRGNILVGTRAFEINESFVPSETGNAIYKHFGVVAANEQVKISVQLDVEQTSVPSLFGWVFPVK